MGGASTQGKEHGQENGREQHESGKAKDKGRRLRSEI